MRAAICKTVSNKYSTPLLSLLTRETLMELRKLPPTFLLTQTPPPV